jgi:hypothetical protein
MTSLSKSYHFRKEGIWAKQKEIKDMLKEGMIKKRRENIAHVQKEI